MSDSQSNLATPNTKRRLKIEERQAIAEWLLKAKMEVLLMAL